MDIQWNVRYSFEIKLNNCMYFEFNVYPTRESNESCHLFDIPLSRPWNEWASTWTTFCSSAASIPCVVCNLARSVLRGMLKIGSLFEECNGTSSPSLGPPFSEDVRYRRCNVRDCRL